jgi:signal peptidase
MSVRRALSVVLTVALLGAVGAFVAQAFPGLVGADYAFVVQSGSMEPAIPVGSVVFVDAVESGQVDTRITEGEVITYTDDGENLITHRVVEKHQAGDSVRFVTKGDANENADPEPVYRNEIVGELRFAVPFIGYVVAFGNTQMGYLALVLVPVMLLIFNELWELYRAMEPETDHD